MIANTPFSPLEIPRETSSAVENDLENALQETSWVVGTKAKPSPLPPCPRSTNLAPVAGVVQW